MDKHELREVKQKELEAYCAKYGHDYSGEGGYITEADEDSATDYFDCKRCGYSTEIVYY